MSQLVNVIKSMSPTTASTTDYISMRLIKDAGSTNNPPPSTSSKFSDENQNIPRGSKR